MLTTTLDSLVASANELAAPYKERWKFETALDDLKSHQRSPRVMVHSNVPDDALQEAYA